MPYTPNATDSTEPTASRELVTAAAEFRALKSSVNTRLAAVEATQARTIRVPESTVSELPIVATRRGKFFAFDAAGNPVTASGTGNDADLRADLSVGSGAALIGCDGLTVQDVLDTVKPMASYTALRAYSGSATGVRITSSGFAGPFQRDDSDTTSADNGGTVIVDASSRRWKRLFDGVIMANWFIASADAGDITLALRRACVAADGVARVVLAPGQYTQETTLQIGDLDSVYLDATGATVTCAANVSMVRSSPLAPYATEPTLPLRWEAVQALTADVDGALDWNARKNITITDGDAYSVGDLVIVVSDDKQRSTKVTGTSSDYRRGWMAFVEAITGDIITLDSAIPWSMSTVSGVHPHIARMPRRYYTIKGGTWGYEAGHEDDSWSPVAFMMYGVSDLNIDIDIEHTYDTGVYAVGCYRPIVKVRGQDLRNDQYDSQYGYLVNDNSYFSRVDIVGGRCRHGYTTGMTPVPSLAATYGGIYELFGATYGALVTGQCNGNSQAGFDTHHGSEACTFQGVKVDSARAGGGSIVIRGKGHKVINPVITNGRDGIFVYTESGVPTGEADQTDVEIIMPMVEADRNVIEISTPARVVVRGGSMRSRLYGQCFQAKGTLVLRGEIDLRVGGADYVSGKRAIYLTDCAVDARGSTVTIDMQDIPAATENWGAITQASASTAATSWIGGTVRTINDTDMTAVFYKEGSPSGTVSFAPERIVTQNAGANPAVGCDITGAGGVGFTGPWKWETESGSYSSSWFRFDVTAGYQLPLRNRGDKLIVARLKPATNLTLGALPTTPVLGQMLAIHQHHTAAGNLTIPHGPSYNTSLPGNTNITLSAGGSLTLAWDGTYWVKAL